MAKGMTTNRYPGKAYQSATTTTVLAIEWKMPTQCWIIQEKGSHINPVKIPMVIGNDE